jgi:hypothetical protein
MTESKKSNGAGHSKPFVEVEVDKIPETIGDDDS